MWSFRRYIHKISTFINTIVPCTGIVNASGGTGVYELQLSVGTDLGLTGIKYNAQGVPDRFQIIWDGNIVADSLYVGNSLSGTPPNYGGLIGSHSLPVFQYNGTEFIATGDVENINVVQADIADRVNQPISGRGTILFNKTAIEPTVVTIRAFGATVSTAWNFSGICPILPGDEIQGDYKVVNGFFSEANKGVTTNLSVGVILGSSPVKFYVNKRGDIDFNTLGWTSTNQWINDGTFWWQIDPQGNILNTGVL